MFAAIAVTAPARSAGRSTTGAPGDLRPAPNAVAARRATVWSTDVVEGATTPPKNQSTNVAVLFDDSAAELPQADIRAAIARELGTSPDRTVVAASREISIGVEANELVVRFSAPDGRAERRVAMPSDARQIPELVRLIAGNLARDPRALVEPSPPVATAREHEVAVATSASSTPKAAPLGYRRHWFGLQVAQDFTYEPGTYVCGPGDQNTTYSCYHAATSTPYAASENSSLRSVQRGVTIATTRLLATYDYALAKNLTLGGRLGFAFRGGPPGAGSGIGVKGAPFIPLHLEARMAWWFAPLTNDRVRAFLGAGAGLMQIDAKPSYVTTCPDSVGSVGGDGCPQFLPATLTPTGSPLIVDVWRKIGRGFVSARTGTEIRLADEVGIELEVNVVAAFPAFGVAFEPAVGVVYGL
jgi:hypothetical protein